MTSTFKTLYLCDLREIKSYFSSQTLSKLAIFLAFILVFTGLEFLTYQIGRQYLYIVRSSRDYAFVTADYILRAIVLLLFWLGIGSSTISTISFLLNKNINLSYLVSLPLNILELVAWRLSKTIFLNTILLSVVLFPVLLVFERGFFREFGFWFYLSTFSLLFSLSTLTSAIGGILGSVLVRINSKPNFIISLLGMGIFIAILVLLFNFIFPTSLYRLAQASPEEFSRIYSSLPLSNKWIPTNWLSGLFTFRSQFYWLTSQVLIYTLLVFYLKFQEKYFLNTYLKISSKPLSQPSIYTHPIPFKKLSPGNSLIVKDFYQIIRSPGEASYALFIYFLVILFFSLFSKARIETEMPSNWINMFITFAFGGLMFFTNTFLLRMAFPAMAREGESRWYLLTLPLPRQIFWWSKLIFVVLMGVPFLLMTLFLWPSLGFVNHQDYLPLTFLSFFLVFIISLSQGFLGLIRPNFQESNSAEKISTSLMGIVTLIITSSLTIIMASGVYFYLAGNILGNILILLSIILSVCILFVLGVTSRLEIDKYRP